MLSGLINKHKGKPAFVLGSGPSLHNLDWKLIEPYITIAVNSTILKTPKADYYLTCDFGMTVWESWVTLRNLKCDLILYNVDVGFRHLEYLTKEDTFEGIDNDRIYYFDMKDSDLQMDGMKLIRGSTSTQVAAHFAHLLGCSPIILVGCDCKYEDRKYHYYDFPRETVDKILKSEYGSFKSWNLIKREGNSNKCLDGHYVCWNKIQKQNPNINIIDTSGGRLDMFPQMTIKEVLKIYGKS